MSQPITRPAQPFPPPPPPLVKQSIQIHHDIGTHVVHHLFPQIPHYNLCEATEAAKKVFGPYYREPVKSGFFPTHLLEPLIRSFKNDHYVDDTGDIVLYKQSPELAK